MQLTIRSIAYVILIALALAKVSTSDAFAQTPEGVMAEASSLAEAMAHEVPNQVARNLEDDISWVEQAKNMLSETHTILGAPQLVVIVDRNPKVQQLRIAVAQEDQPWMVLGGTLVSTGQAGRFDHYITPTGVFLHTDAILDYRAEGTYNENHIRGYGIKGMRVWDLGWQTARKGWLKSGEEGEIRMEMHATDPDVLEARLGHPASQGCIRIPAALNRFIDIHGVIDADYEVAAATNKRYAEVLKKDRKPSSLSGRAIIVIDSSKNRS